MYAILNDLKKIAARRNLPEEKIYLELVNKTIDVLQHESPDIRPQDSSGVSGGLLTFTENIPTVIVPDLHGRTDFFLNILEYSLFGRKMLLESLAEGTIRLLCLGDAFHGERRAKARWKRAHKSFLQGDIMSSAMIQEMAENFALMEMIMRCKCAFPQHMHFLKGNHENILNEEGEGNHPFLKYAEEGEMVLDFVLRRYGKPFLQTYAQLEKSFPLCVIGERFLASHAEPECFYTKEELINTRKFPDVILGLTWTNNGAAAKNAVAKMLAEYLPLVPDAMYFGGHRPVEDQFSLRAENRFIQIHNPERQNVAIVPADRRFNPETDIKHIKTGV
ncbi:MAG: metallophosphoesterase [Treponema sp.]|jgi:hypothetical protein|nr:metallophosphoesterase [Treponema sp.]